MEINTFTHKPGHNVNTQNNQGSCMLSFRNLTKNQVRSNVQTSLSLMS